MKNKFKKGASLYFVVITILLIFSSVLVLGNIIYVRIKMIRDKGDSVTAFFAADAGVEQLLYMKYQNDLPDEETVYPLADDSCYELNNLGVVPYNDTSYCYKVMYILPVDASDSYKIISKGKYKDVNRGIMVRWQ